MKMLLKWHGRLDEEIKAGGTYSPISGMVSEKYFWKNSTTSSPVVIFSKSSKGMKRVQVNVLS